jgi:hypothetical protein
MNAAEIRELVIERLPKRYEPLQLTFYHEKRGPAGDYVLIGDDYGTQLCVHLTDGAVYSIDPESEYPTRFVNSGVHQLAKFIQTYQSYAALSKTDAELVPVAARMRAELASLDSAAFSDSDNWWSLVLEQVEDGLL